MLRCGVGRDLEFHGMVRIGHGLGVVVPRGQPEVLHDEVESFVG